MEGGSWAPAAGETAGMEGGGKRGLYLYPPAASPVSPQWKETGQ